MVHLIRERLRQLWAYKDFLSLMLLLIISGSIWSFVELADELVEGELKTLDTRILLTFRSSANIRDPIGPRWFEEMIRDATALGSSLILTLLVLAVITTLWLERRRGAALLIVAASLGGLVASTILKNGFGRERPDILASHLLPPSHSFPSGHSMLAAAIYLTIAAVLAHVVRRKLMVAFVIFIGIGLTLLVGFSRVYLGVHYPSDVLAGWTLGLGWAAICWLVAWKLRGML